MINIDAVDAISHDVATLGDRGFFPHALRITSLSDLVRQLTTRIGFSRDLRRLRIIGHGEPGAQGLGDSYEMDIPARRHVFDSSLAVSADWFMMENLADLFSPDGWVELHGCNVALGYAGKMYLGRLAQLLHVPVRAGIAPQIGGSRAADEFLWGQWREARPLPNGGISYHVFHAFPSHHH